MNSMRLLTVHPGIILLEAFLEPLAISQDRLARDLHVQPHRIHEIVQGQRPISAEIALRLAHYFGVSKRFWLDLQARYDRERERARFGHGTRLPLRHAGF